MDTLVIFAHTYWKDSKANKALLEAASKLENVKIHNLTTTYPTAAIDVDKEISLLKETKKIVFQFPLFWFSTPSIMKEWEDVVLGKILYGDNPKLLSGKTFKVITTAGGTKETYEGHHGYTIETLMLPLNCAFQYIGCKIDEPYAIFKANAPGAVMPIDEYLANLK
ncbi:flavodoxin family protein [Helicobacter saguini]|uniref:Flavodoxin family protein n=1 Tax=Helicobacter saguini TaxID=1548018 RepID=A0A347VRL5_9HELI|nr:NAD(P)H-dependent oxidoreductase [Helicobacter saguini]MWV62857.1 flavodoxin family protein [Helicobacter saguini]MWV66472.1 flavodoxin family protein [Helicobacter saguini]MWV68822.1 flavodoxin family protein [Helicobacter saguini]MWV71623.1 flavodoxin family protein [Helicobacter saguini]TLD94428.1 flavodoxin family protein [Helicobacter saguini]